MANKHGQRNWRDPPGYPVRLVRQYTQVIFESDPQSDLEQLARICVDPHIQHRRTIVLYDKPAPDQVRGFVGLIKEVYNSPVSARCHDTTVVVTFFVDTGDTYLGVKVAASLCRLRWRHR